MCIDTFSYLLGKKQGGGGEEPTLISKNITANGTYNASSDNADGYSSVSVNVAPDLSDYFGNTIESGDSTGSGFAKMVKTIPSTTTVSGTSLNKAFYNFNGTTIPLINTSNVKDTQYMFSGAKSLISVPLLDMHKVTNTSRMFELCESLIEVPQFNTEALTNMTSMFTSCTALTTIPLLDTSKITKFLNAFYGCPNLTDASLDNILQMCINATSYQSSKYLTTLGFESTNYPAARIEALPHYQDFVDAGWGIGY